MDFGWSSPCRHDRPGVGRHVKGRGHADRRGDKAGKRSPRDRHRHGFRPRDGHQAGKQALRPSHRRCLRRFRGAPGGPAAAAIGRFQPEKDRRGTVAGRPPAGVSPGRPGAASRVGRDLRTQGRRFLSAPLAADCAGEGAEQQAPGAAAGRGVARGHRRQGGLSGLRRADLSGRHLLGPRISRRPKRLRQRRGEPHPSSGPNHHRAVHQQGRRARGGGAGASPGKVPPVRQDVSGHAQGPQAVRELQHLVDAHAAGRKELS